MSAATTKSRKALSTGAALNFVTAIVDSELEATTAQLLYSHGNNIIFRALTEDSLEKYLLQNNINLQVLYSSDFISSKNLGRFRAKFTKVIFKEVSEQGFDPANLLSEVSQKDRQPLVRSNTPISNLISVIGTSGSPGISTVTNQLAARVDQAVIFYFNNHLIRPDAAPASKLSEATPTNWPELITRSEQIFFDAGCTSALTSTLSDRRISGLMLNQALNSSSKLLYVLKADTAGISQLSRFINDYANLIAPPAITYILNQQRFDAKARLINSQFLSIVAGQKYFQVPFDYSEVGKYPAKKALFATTFSKQFDAIAKSLA